MVSFALMVAVALSGAPKKTQLKIEVKPEAAVIFVDGKKKGTGAKPLTLNVEPGAHRIKVVHKLDEHEEVVPVKKGEVKTFQWAFEDDRMDRKKAAEEEEEEEEAVPATRPPAGPAPDKKPDEPVNVDDPLAPSPKK